MIKKARSDAQIYRSMLVSLDDDELKKEIWLLDEHIKYLHENDDQSVQGMIDLLKIAKEEKDRRMFNKGYV